MKKLTLGQMRLLAMAGAYVLMKSTSLSGDDRKVLRAGINKLEEGIERVQETRHLHTKDKVPA